MPGSLGREASGRAGPTGCGAFAFGLRCRLITEKREECFKQHRI
uniref:Complement C5 n=1 Tax=Homo sapiens TaxID=9606 RepID=A0A8V8TN26_HUMAN